MLNNGVENCIELDAASNNSVEDMRKLTQESNYQDLTSDYKCYIIDECMTGDTEILTFNGYKRLDELNNNDYIAQYTDEGNIEFVKPIRLIKNHFEGELECWMPRRGHTIKMTPNHIQPLYYLKSKKIKEQYIKDIKFTQSKNIIVAGKGIGKKKRLSILDKMAILSQADGTIQKVNKNYTRWTIQLKKERKIQRFLEIASQINCELSEIKSRKGCRRFGYSLPNTITKKLSSYFDLDVSYEYAREFINECVLWDGYTTKDYIEYMSTEEENTNFVSAMATLGGFSCKQKIKKDNRKENYNDIYALFLYDIKYRSCANIQKTRNKEYFNGEVYCVEVPSHKIIVRAEGFTFITGNCHSLSNQAWQSLLKTLEEPPAKTIFILCTTDPQKIPKTILSRVQRFDFKKISYEGIIDRLLFILESEKMENEAISYDYESVEYIARLSQGGLRDAITSLDKCLSYSNELTVDNVMKCLEIVDFDKMLKLSEAIMKTKLDAINIIEDIYNNGNDIKIFVKQYLDFVVNHLKYFYTNNEKVTLFSKEFCEKLSNFNMNIEKYLNLMEMLMFLNDSMRYETNPKILLEANLMKFMKDNI